MINAIPVTQFELSAPARGAAAPSAASVASTGFSEVKDGVFEALGLKDSGLKELDPASAADSGVMALWLSMFAAAQETGSVPEELPQLSKCGDPVEGIAGILEGFGLLNADGGLTGEAQELLNAAVGAAPVQPEAEQAGMPPVQPDAAGDAELISGSGENGENAVPPTQTQDTALREAVLPLLAPLVSDYLRSLENAHSPSDAQPRQDIEPQAASAPEAMPAAAFVAEDTASPLEKLAAAVQEAVNGKVELPEPPVPPREEASGVPQKMEKPADHTGPTATLGSIREKLTPVTITLDDAMTAPAAATANAAAPVLATEASVSQADAAPAQPGAGSAETVLDLVESVYAKTREGASEFEVSLKPEYLGKLTIKLTQDADGLKAQIKAADASVRSLLENELGSLQAQLREKGVEVTKIDVAYEAASLGFNGSQARGQGNGAQESRRRLSVLSVERASAYGAAEAPPADAGARDVQDAARLSLQGGSVEFSA